MFGINYEKLALLKRQYDPRNVFNKFVDFDAAYPDKPTE
jgi:FAD/FMN-containing dehydrogenase